MNRDPRAWAILGSAIRDDRDRQGLTRDQVVDRVKARGGEVTARTIGTFERGQGVPKTGGKPQKLEQVVAALGWQPGFVDRILDGEKPAAVLAGDEPSPAGPAETVVMPARQAMFELLPGVYEFGRAAVAAGAAPELRDDLEAAARNLIASTAGRIAPDGSTYGLVAYSPHRAGEPVPEDDAERIQQALRRR